LVALSGCAASQYTATGACVEGESIILAVTGSNPSALDKTLLAVNLVDLEKGTYTADQATEMLDGIEGVLTDGVSYLGLKQYLDRKIAAAAVIVLGDSVDNIAQQGADTIISDCDKQLILAHIEHQRAIVALY
jgi:hypothetical protein